MNDLDDAVRATLAYYGTALRWPLTAIEVHARLIPAQRLGGRQSRHSSLGEVVAALDGLVASNEIIVDSGLYALELPQVLARDRAQKECARKWKLMLRYAWWFQVMPYVRGLFASGSLALGNTSESSDWDVFVVAEKHRLYTARLFLLICAKIMGRLRTKYDAQAPDTFCFNHWITTDGLRMGHWSLFTAHALASLIPFYDPRGYLMRLWHANHWIEEYVAQPTGTAWARRSVRPSRVLGIGRRFTEVILNSWVGGLLEGYLKRWMQGRIAREPATHARGGRIIATDYEIEFHPRSFEAVALARYNTCIARRIPGAHSEKDSGLTR